MVDEDFDEDQRLNYLPNLGSCSHAYGVSNASSKRASGGLNAWGVVLGRGELGVTRSHGVVATEVLHLLKRKGVASKVQP